MSLWARPGSHREQQSPDERRLPGARPRACDAPGVVRTLRRIAAWAQRRPELALFVIALTAAALHLAASAAAPFPYIFNDELEYWLYAHQIAAGQWAMTWWQGSLTHYPAYVYPLWLAAVTRFGGSAVVQFWLARSVDALAMTSAAYFVFVFARALGLAAGPALWAAALALCVGGVDFSTQIMAEALFYPLLMLSLYVLWRHVEDGRPSLAFASGFLMAISVFTKPQGLVLLFATLALLPLLKRRLGLRALTAALALYILGALPPLLVRLRIAEIEGFHQPLSLHALLGMYAAQVPTASVPLAVFATTAALYALIFIIVGAGVPLAVLAEVRAAWRHIPSTPFWIELAVVTGVLWLAFSHNGAAHGARLEERYLFEALPLWFIAHMRMPAPARPQRRLLLVLVPACTALFLFLMVPSLGPYVPFDAPSLTAVYALFTHFGWVALIAFGAVFSALATAAIMKRSVGLTAALLLLLSFSYYVAMPTLPEAQDYHTAMRLLPFLRAHIPPGAVVNWADKSIPLGVMRNIEFFGLVPWTGASETSMRVRTGNEWYFTNRLIPGALHFDGYSLLPPPTKGP